ncbi:MAG: proline/glycine betaine ABC transporter permease [Firmicutes bacterium]|nr:proline/glycine betaine ABC transporter permease [Bacillota bacterium]
MSNIFLQTTFLERFQEYQVPIGDWFAAFIDWLTDTFNAQFDAIRSGISWLVELLADVLGLFPFWALALVIAVLAWRLAGRGEAIFAFLGVLLIANIGLWPATVSTLALIITATLIALLIGVPLGILGAKFGPVNTVLRPLLDLMQTMPAFVYLIPAVFFFRIGAVPAVFATIIFAMPPAIRLTSLGIRQVPQELIEAGEAFGSNWYQLLFKVQLPQALPTIMAGINQCIMLSLSMVVIASMIGAGGLGSVVLTGIDRLNVGMGFEGGLAVVIIAIILDRLTQGKGSSKGYRN